MNQDAARAVNLTNAIDLVINVSPCSIDEPTNISPGAKFNNISTSLLTSVPTTKSMSEQETYNLMVCTLFILHRT